jgi:hypothetical protein
MSSEALSRKRVFASWYIQNIPFGYSLLMSRNFGTGGRCRQIHIMAVAGEISMGQTLGKEITHHSSINAWW